MTTLDKAERIIKAGINVAKQGFSQVDAIQFFDGYAEPGYSDPKSGLIALGNWNSVTEYRRGKFITVDDTPDRVGALLEKLGVELEWSDEWISCEECGKLFRVKPDSYRWQLAGVVDENGITCGQCLGEDPTDYLESLENDPRRCNTIEAIDPEDHGYLLLEDRFEHGLYGNQDADPRVIAESLRKHVVERFLFHLNSTSQFACSFSVYLHASQMEKFLTAQFALETEPTDGPSVVGALQSALQDANRKMAQLEGEGVRYAKCKADGTADVRLISPEELVRGIER